MTPDNKEKLQAKVHHALNSYSSEELALGWLQYEALRKLTSQQYAKLNDAHIKAVVVDGERITFDDLVNEMVVKP